MVYANTIVVATIGLVMTTSSPKDFTAFRVLLSLLGLVLCFVWWMLLRRGFQYFTYWILSARELERVYLSDIVKTVVRGQTYSETGKATFEGEIKPLVASPPLIKVELASYIVVGAFALLYVLALLVP
jgi:hypothetical protein